MNTNTRRWFQLHLSTSVVLMVVASGLLYLNAVERVSRIERGPSRLFYEEGSDTLVSVYFTVRGWPIVYHDRMLPLDHFEADSAMDLGGLCLNGCICLAIATGLTFLLEYLIRRREARDT